MTQYGTYTWLDRLMDALIVRPLFRLCGVNTIGAAIVDLGGED